MRLREGDQLEDMVDDIVQSNNSRLAQLITDFIKNQECSHCIRSCLKRLSGDQRAGEGCDQHDVGFLECFF